MEHMDQETIDLFCDEMRRSLQKISNEIPSYMHTLHAALVTAGFTEAEAHDHTKMIMVCLMQKITGTQLNIQV